MPFKWEVKQILILAGLLLGGCRTPAPTDAPVAPVLPVLGWYSIPEDQISVQRFTELRRSGLTHSFSFFDSDTVMKKALDSAAVAGVKLIAACPGLRARPEATVRQLKNHPALAGYFLVDEPAPEAFQALGEWVRKIQRADPDHFCYINLLPNYADMQQLGVKDYRAYVHRFITEVPVRLLTFDFYPVVGDTIRPGWYDNLEVFSDEARKAGKPFWAFALATAHADYPIPTLAQLRLQVYSNLAYGAQGIEYFTYWTPESTTWDFHRGPITRLGQRTEVYDRIKQINKEIQALSEVFVGAQVISVSHTGAVIPNGTHRLGKLPAPITSLETGGSGAVVALLENKGWEYLLVVNRNFKNAMPIRISCTPFVQRILKDGSAVAADRYVDRLQVAPGDVVIYRWSKDEQ